MKRIQLKPRAGWREKNAELGLDYGEDEHTYWSEDVAYELTLAQVEQIEEATQTLHGMCLAAVSRVINENLWDRFNIPTEFRKLICDSWFLYDTSIYGRFDLAYDGVNPPKLLEYNADTPTSLVEAAVIQWEWLEGQAWQLRNKDQFNSIHDRLVAAWQQYAKKHMVAGEILHFTSMADNVEDFRTVEYMMETAKNAGLSVCYLPLEMLGVLDGEKVNPELKGLSILVDESDRQIRHLFKLYPWEWLLKDRDSKALLEHSASIIEPPWKMILSNKAILPLLWEMFEGHENLLEARYDLLEGACAQNWQARAVRKPCLGREGANVTLPGQSETVGDYGGGEFIYQAYAPLPVFEGKHVLTGSWIVDGIAAGVGFRESDGPVTDNASRFVPHYFVE